MYSHILNPETGRKVNIHGNIGKKILNKYVNQLNGGKKNIAYMTYGRFQPPHKSHTKLIDFIIQESKIDKVDAFLFTSQKDNNFDDDKNARSYLNSVSESSRNKKSENPIKIQDKLQIINKLYSDKEINIVDVISENIKSPFDAIFWLKSKNFDEIVFFVGSDRLDNFQKAFNRMNMDYVKVRELIRSDNDVSGTKVRKLALDTIINFVTRLEEINFLLNNISSHELKHLKKIVNLYSKIKGKDLCYRNLNKILKLFKNSNDESCKKNINMVKYIVNLIQQGTKIPDKFD